MGNTMKQERDLVRRWEDVADELPRALGAPGQVMLVPRPSGRPGLAVVVGGRDGAAIIPAAQEGEWEVSFELGALDTLPYTGEYAPQIADRLIRCVLTRLACEAPVKAAADGEARCAYTPEIMAGVYRALSRARVGAVQVIGADGAPTRLWAASDTMRVDALIMPIRFPLHEEDTK